MAYGNYAISTEHADPPRRREEGVHLCVKYQIPLCRMLDQE